MHDEFCFPEYIPPMCTEISSNITHIKMKDKIDETSFP